MVDIRADSAAAIPSSPPARNRDLRPKRTFDPMIILWIVLALLLLFLIVNPLLRLIVDSFRQVNGSEITFANYISAFSRARHIQAVDQHALDGKLCVAHRCLDGGAARLGGVAHRHAGPGPGPTPA